MSASLRTSHFDKCFAYTLKNEGGYSHHVSDKGGRTNYGITEATAARHGIDDVSTITLNEARNIYNLEYWTLIQGDYIKDLDRATVLFDQAVNCGVKTAVKRFQIAYNAEYPEKELTIDGVCGPQTARALNDCADTVFTRFVALTIAYYSNIVFRRVDQRVFYRGWLKRAGAYIALFP